MLKKLLAVALFSTAAVTSVTVPGVASAQVYVQTAPPPARVEVIPAPRRGHVWVNGHWQWRGHRYFWVPGHWVVARPGYRYLSPGWVERGGRWQYNRGRWDRDHDGVPDRYDRHPNNPYRR